jgi:hypothetical protein
MSKVIHELNVIKNTEVYDNLSVTGKKLGDLDIYIDKLQDKYAVVCGESLVYLPIDKDGVVKLEDGAYAYWKESMNTFNYILVGKSALEFEKKQAEVPTCGGINVYINDLYTSELNCWEQDGEVYFNIDNLCKVICCECIDTEYGCRLSLLNGKLELELYKDGTVKYQDTVLETTVKYDGDSFIVSREFCETALGMEIELNGDDLSVTGEILPSVVLLDRYTATGAIKKPYDGERNGISILKVFGIYDQYTDIQEGKMSKQVYLRRCNK